MLLFILLLVVLGIVWHNNYKNLQKECNKLRGLLAYQRQNGLDFLLGYKAVAKTPAEKALLQRMEADYRHQQGLPEAAVDAPTPAAKAATAVVGTTDAAAAAEKAL